LGRKLNFAPGKIPLSGKRHEKCIYCVKGKERKSIYIKNKINAKL